MLKYLIKIASALNIVSKVVYKKYFDFLNENINTI